MAIFDGSELEGAISTSVVIGPKKVSQSKTAKMLSGPYWPIRMAFFSPAEKQIEPEYEITINLHSNGVVSALILDYGDIIIDVELVELNFLENSFCK